MKNYLISIIALIIISLSMTMCVEDAIPPSPAAEISNLSLSMVSPTPVDSVTVSAIVTSEYGLTSVQLVYIIDETETVLDMLAESDVYSAKIPPQLDGTKVFYYLKVENNNGVIVYFPNDAPNSPLSYTVSQGGETIVKIVINEFCCSNDNMVVEGAAAGDYPDWFELYNAGNVPVNIAGWYITDSFDELTQCQIPDTDEATTTIPVGGFLVIYCDGYPEEGPLHVDFKLSSGGDDIGVSANGLNYTDSLTFADEDRGIPLPRTDNSAGLTVDGGNTWIEFSIDEATPGSSNSGN